MKPIVSIITPTFNREKLLHKTINSVINQNYQNIEYIVVDGKSTDGTIALLEQFSKKDKLKFLSEKDDSMYDAVNKGFRIAKGDIFAYLNSDDRYFPWTVEKVVDFFSKNKSVDLIYGDSLVVDNKNNKLINIYPKYNSEYLISGNILCQPTIFFKKSIFHTIGDFGLKVSFLADCEYWLRVLQSNFVIKKINEILAIEYNHPDSIRYKFPDKISQEKYFLFNQLNHNNIHNYIYYFKNYIEKEIYYFLFYNNFKNSYWKYFRKEYKIAFSFSKYIISKLKREPFLISVISNYG